MQGLLLRNVRAIVTCDAEDQVFYDTDVLVRGPQIVQIGKNLAASDVRIIDGRDKFMYPGLINTHHHFFQAFVRNFITIDRPNITEMELLEEAQKTFQKVDS